VSLCVKGRNRQAGAIGSRGTPVVARSTAQRPGRAGFAARVQTRLQAPLELGVQRRRERAYVLAQQPPPLGCGAGRIFVERDA
jgi:hypothetical protein